MKLHNLKISDDSFLLLAKYNTVDDDKTKEIFFMV
jgi:hypothetical protein